MGIPRSTGLLGCGGGISRERIATNMVESVPVSDLVHGDIQSESHTLIPKTDSCLDTDLVTAGLTERAVIEVWRRYFLGLIGVEWSTHALE